jgi:hypothetical protein
MENNLRKKYNFTGLTTEEYTGRTPSISLYEKGKIGWQPPKSNLLAVPKEYQQSGQLLRICTLKRLSEQIVHSVLRGLICCEYV